MVRLYQSAERISRPGVGVSGSSKERIAVSFRVRRGNDRVGKEAGLLEGVCIPQNMALDERFYFAWGCF
jgi:hypothetical protein